LRYFRRVGRLGAEDPAGRCVIFGFLSFAKVDTFAKGLAALLSKRYPPVIANNPEQAVPPQRVSEILEASFSDASRFQQENRLGLLGRAKLGGAFKWELREIGYGEKFIGFATEKLIEQLTTPTD